MDENKEVEVKRKETKSNPSNVGVAVIKYGTTLIIFFGILWFLIKFILPMF